MSPRPGVRPPAPHRSRLLAAVVVAAWLVMTAAPSVLASAPSNDDRSAAVPVDLFGFGQADLTEATRAVDDPAPCVAGSTEYGSVWFSFTARDAGPARIAFGDVSDSAAVHVLGPDGGQLACDVQPSRLRPQTGGGDYVQIDAVVGSTYLIELTTVSPTPPWSASINIEPPLRDVTLVSVSEGTLTPAGDAVFELGFSCPASVGYIEILVEVTQHTRAGTVGANGDHPGANCTHDVAVNPAELVARDPWHEVDGQRIHDESSRLVAGPASMRIEWTMVTATESKRVVETKAVQLVGGGAPGATVPPTSTISRAPASDGPGPTAIVVIAARLMGLAIPALACGLWFLGRRRG